MANLPGSPTYRLRLHTGPVKEARRSVTPIKGRHRKVPGDIVGIIANRCRR